MKISHHAKIRFLQRVIGTDNDDYRSLNFAARILEDNCCHIDVGVSVDLPIIGFKGYFARVRNNTVITVINKGKKDGI